MLKPKGVWFMELTPRKRAILAAIIDSYILSGEPVGSKALCELLDIGVSSATLRNEMSDLCQMGFLNQPHTSAGRIPTSRGYQLYVSDLMTDSAPSPEIKIAIDSILQSISHTPEQMPTLATERLSDLTGLPAFSAILANDSAKIKRVRLIPMGKRTLLMVVISTDGVARSRIVLSDCVVDEALLSVYSNICKACIIGHRLYELNRAYLQSIVARLGDYSLSIMPLLSTMFEIIAEMFEPQLIFKGEANLFSGYRQPAAARLGELISEKSTVLSLISQMNETVEVMFSDEYSPDTSTEPCCMVVAKFSTGQRELGRIGVLGPARIAYEQLIPSIEYFANRLGTLMTKAMRDMED